MNIHMVTRVPKDKITHNDKGHTFIDTIGYANTSMAASDLIAMDIATIESGHIDTELYQLYLAGIDRFICHLRCSTYSKWDKAGDWYSVQFVTEDKNNKTTHYRTLLDIDLFLYDEIKYLIGLTAFDHAMQEYPNLSPKEKDVALRFYYRELLNRIKSNNLDLDCCRLLDKFFMQQDRMDAMFAAIDFIDHIIISGDKVDVTNYRSGMNERFFNGRSNVMINLSL